MLETEEQKTLYALGLALAQNLGVFGLSEADLAVVEQGMRDSVLKKELKVSLQEYGPKLQTMAQERAKKIAEMEKSAAAEFLAAAAAEEGAMKKESGLIIKEITPGTGASPAATDKVTVHYHGTLRDGSVFDSSVER
ncbi:MAG: FKBP-type peptidyl-prolyl cis-trans isomerase, partial [Acidobacteria bacterium]|nr:FKBP-type peptidyl-prolyl cis-trans isomerase [Acidobacteriota bacterium]